MEKEEKYAVILAGGGGTRLWPLSRKSAPKQFHKLFDSRTLLQETFDRISGAFSPSQIYIVTSKEFVPEIKKEIKDIPSKNILLEPAPKNTAAAAGLAATYIARRNPGAVLSTFAADHYVKEKKRFLNTVIASQETAKRGDYIVTIGISPSSPHTGFGYIHTGDRVSQIRKTKVYKVKEFKEKPNLATAREYVRGGDYFWNANINSYKVSTILTAIKKHFPVLSSVLEEFNSVGFEERTKKAWLSLPSESIDTAILEKAKNVLMVPASFSWLDIGDWAALYSVLAKKNGDNVVIRKEIDTVNIDSKGCLIYSDFGLVATIGVGDLVIVKSGDTTLVCSRSHAQEVKKIVERLGKEKKERFL